VASRFYRWQKAGVWQRLFDTVQQQADAAGQLDGEIHDVDGTIVRAHQHAAGVKKGTRKPGPEGAVVLPQLLKQGAVRRVGRGRPKRRPHRLVGDTG
jgi:transposase